MSSDHHYTTTPGYRAFAACRLGFSEGRMPSSSIELMWSHQSQGNRDVWHAAAQAARADLLSQVASLTKALEGLTLQHTPVTVDYTNHAGARGERHIKPMVPFYGTTNWHTDAGFMLPCWDTDRGEYRIYSFDGIHAWNGQPVNDTVTRINAENLALRTELAAMTARYTAAVNGRAAFREAFRDFRELLKGHMEANRANTESREPAPDSISNAGRITLIKQAQAKDAILRWSDDRRDVIGKVHRLIERLDGSASVTIAVCDRQGLVWTATGELKSIEVHLLTTIGDP